ncbi:MAG: mismatch repair protein MutS2 [Clostridia bacterium]|nr:mismatch repair protein MutS2 [Clostridia bacterium]
MNKSNLKLELNKILDRLEANCISPLGAELVKSLEPVRDLETVKRRQMATTEGDQILLRYPDLPLGNIYDVRPEIRRAAVGGLLEGSELLRVKTTLVNAWRIRKFILGIEGEWPNLKQMVSNIGDFRKLTKAIENSIGPEGEVMDQATPRLFNLRQQIKRTQDRIKERLDSFLRSSEMQKYLQDNLYTIRNDRYVLPVKQEYRQHVRGLIHDQSASGATLFIEPMALVELNNELRQLQAAEYKEVEEILMSLSSLIKEEKDNILATLTALGELDFTLAKGRLSHKMKAQPVSLNSKGCWRINKGRHPLLGDKVVPVTIELGYDFDTLVITGPNTGGKTVTLKTIGLFTLMAQCGLHLPAAESTEISVTASVYADIGDEQSIEQSLSTFSAHMDQIINILKEVKPGSLVLLDELGAGTDPTEGAALAMAILDYLTEAGVRTVATTHYSELKAYAYATPRVENAAVEFDSRTLRPTYNLIIGTPGESNAFTIASRLGLPQSIIERGRSLLSEESKRVSRLISGLTEDKRVSAEERAKAERIRIETEAKKAEIEKAKLEWQKKAAKQTEKMREEARLLLRRARAEIREIMSGLEKELAKESVRDKQRAIEMARRRLKNLEEDVEGKITSYQPVPSGKPPAKVKAGDRVIIQSVGQEGEVINPPNDQGEVLVRVGVLKMNVNLKDLRLIKSSPRVKKQTQTDGWTVRTTSTNNISPEIDLRGMTVEEAIHQTDKYLDDVVLSGLNRVSIIHGKGTGVLRGALQDYLRNHPLVKSFRLGGAGEGGSGVTVVDVGK